MSDRQIPIFAPGQLTEEMRAAWAQASTNNPPAWLECQPLRDEDGGIVCAGPVGYFYVPVSQEARNV